MKKDSSSLINMFMMINFRSYEQLNYFIPPSTEILTCITKFGHKVTCLLTSKKIKEPKTVLINQVYKYILPCENLIKSLDSLSLKSIRCYIKRIRFLNRNFERNNYNVVYVRNEIFNGLLALYLRKNHKFVFVVEIENPFEQDFYFRKQYYPKYKLVFYFISKIEEHIKTYILRRADLIFPVGDGIKDYLIEKGFEDSQMMVLPNGVDTKRFSINIDSSGLKEKYRLNNSKVFTYIGSLNKARSLSIMINAFFRVRKFFDVKLLIVGEGTDKYNLIKMVENLGIKEDVIFTGFVDQDDVPKFIHCADYCLSPIQPLEIYKVSCPIKLHEYMAMGKPVIANKEIYEQRRIIEDSNGGLLVEFDEISFADAMIKLLKDPEMAQKMGKNAYNWLTNNRSYEIIALNSIKKISEMLNKNKL